MVRFEEALKHVCLKIIFVQKKKSSKKSVSKIIVTRWCNKNISVKVPFFFVLGVQMIYKRWFWTEILKIFSFQKMLPGLSSSFQELILLHRKNYLIVS